VSPSLGPERTQFREARASLHQRQLAGVDRIDASRDYFSECLGYFNGERRTLPCPQHLWALATYYESRLDGLRADLRAAVDARDKLLAVLREEKRG
jgi:hypothetical protein